MKFDKAVYQKYTLPLGTKFYERFRFPLEVAQSVTFRENKRLPIYSWFPYKQGFSRALVFRIIKKYDLPATAVVYDPFLGSGTTALACIEKGLSGYGSDHLPLCQFVANAKVNALLVKPSEIVPAAERVIATYSTDLPPWPIVPIVEKALSPQVQKSLMTCRRNIEREDISGRLKRVLLLALLSSVEKCSLIKKDGGFPRIVPDKEIGDVTDVFMENCARYASDLRQFHTENPSLDTTTVKRSRITMADARNVPLEEQSVDLVITSPPYLNKTDYTRVYALELCLMFVENFPQLRQLRYDSFCGHVEAKPTMGRILLPNSITNGVRELSKQHLSNPKHPAMVEGYYQDLHHCLSDNFRYLRKGGRAAWVVWNSRFSGVQFSVDVHLAEIAERIGFQVEEIECMRLTGTSAQQTKTYGDEALRESIVYLKRPQ